MFVYKVVGKVKNNAITRYTTKVDVARKYAEDMKTKGCKTEVKLVRI